ncbi:hypothetical protein HPB50_006599 [Hyalomma asiaticum]|uniref:Uncharacterized protein n=1 Tax=Hyalomma asiaticum TaxID=266040 RepID=A0ACB7SS65_HYAAI|nr:hypothetical protein HPB50_006599 [Hyalomma asiaticum]
MSAIKTEVGGPGVSPTTEFLDASAIKTEVNSAEVSLRTEISDVSEIATEVTETCMDGSSVCSIAENNNETLKISSTLPTPSSGSELPSLAPNVKCEEVSENLVAGTMVNSSSEQHSIPSKNGNKETAIAKVKTGNIEEIPSSEKSCSSADMLSSSSSISDFESGGKSAAFKLEFDREDKSESSTSSSSEESSRATSESSRTVEDWEQKKRRATRGQFHNRKNTCKRVARSAQARRPRAYTWITSDSSGLSSDTDDDYEWHISSRSKSCTRKRKAPTRRKCAPHTPPPPPLSEEVIRRYLEEAFERYQDPKLVMHMTVDIERLPDYQFSSATKRMKTERDDWSFVEGLADACNIAKTRSYDSSMDGEDQERPLEQHDGHEEFVVSPAKDPDGKGRRNIRKLISDEELAQQTRAAAQAEEERKQRIAERRKLYYEVLGAQVSDAHETVKELVLEVDLQTKEPLVQVNEKLVKFMKPHQVKGVKFIYDCVIESLEMLKKDPEKGSGCILAHCMGLGKSFQVISFLHTVMTHKEAGALLRTALVICPYNTVVNWANEFDLWLHRNGLEMKVYEVSSMKVNTVRLESLEKWQSEGGVVIIGYSMFCQLIRGSGKRKNRAMLSRYKRILLNPGKCWQQQE